ncbi:amidohydrolase [Staphylococcus caprae]|uniref:amidohydrolase family protein n=1 Tax=Staphylococcus caprae TaxID=29380 RepID=UPI001F595566|nr:amidohydrolase family protein [Staphylococcus caprae]MCI2954803.1 amidohydrolase [Staphylococcus caprae]
MNNKREIIDIHHHIIPKIYKDALKKIGVTTAGGYPIKDWEPQDSIQMMDALNIQVGVTSISEPATLPFKRKQAAKVAREVNEYQAELKRTYPGRFKCLALLPMPHVKETIKEIEYALDVLKLDGVGLLSNYDQSYLGDDEFDKVMANLNQRDAIVFVHPSSASSRFKAPQFVFADFIEEFTFNTTRAASNLIFSGTMERYSNIKFILAHAGGTLPYLKWRINETLNTQKYVMEDPKNRLKSFITGKKSDLAKEVAKHPIRYAQMFKTYKKGLDRWSTLSQSAEDYMRQFYYDTALSTGESAFASLNEVTDKSHILFGSDAHYAPNDWIAKMEKNIEESRYFNEKDKQNIFQGNTAQILK